MRCEYYEYLSWCGDYSNGRVYLSSYAVVNVVFVRCVCVMEVECSCHASVWLLRRTIDLLWLLSLHSSRFCSVESEGAPCSWLTLIRNRLSLPRCLIIPSLPRPPSLPSCSLSALVRVSMPSSFHSRPIPASCIVLVCLDKHRDVASLMESLVITA